MPADPACILEDLAPFYQPGEFPVLLHQYETWRQSRPLQGLHLIDASPVFRNTTAKYAALLAAGAKLTVAVSSVMPHDPAILPLLRHYGIPVMDAQEATGPYDVVMDCAGALAHIPSRFGYVELTRSGAIHYEHCHQPVWMVDAGKIKQIETCLGTGESFFRAMASLGYRDWAGKTLLIAGCGKVGRGIALCAFRLKAHVIMADVRAQPLPHPTIRFVSASDRTTLNRELAQAFCAVTATGKRHAMEGLAAPGPLQTSRVLLANMGVENEWGPSIPPQRMLNNGKTLNFILPDPTLMPYIDPPLALHNRGAVELHAGRCLPGLFTPPSDVEEEFLTLVRSGGAIPPELLDSLL